MLLGYIRELWRDLTSYTMPHQLMEDDKSDDVIEMIDLLYGNQVDEFNMSPAYGKDRDTSGVCGNLESSAYCRMNTLLGESSPFGWAVGWAGSNGGGDAPDICQVESDCWHVEDDACGEYSVWLMTGWPGEGGGPRWFPAEAGEEYTASIYAKVAAAGMILSRMYVLATNHMGTPIGPPIAQIGLPITFIDFERFNTTFTLPDLPAIGGFMFWYILYATAPMNSYDIKLKNFQVELGGTMTQFCVA